MDRSLVRRLRRIVGHDGVLDSPEARSVYASDMLTYVRGAPDVVVLPRDAEQAAAAVAELGKAGLPVTPRGSGSGLIGGAATPGGGVVVGLNRMNRVLEVDLGNRSAIVEAGLINADLGAALDATGYTFAPDPSSQVVSTIGGNVSTNAGGPHCLKHGTTVNHVLGVEVVTADGDRFWVGGPVRDRLGYDLAGLMVGSEGTLALVTAVAVALTHRPEAVRTLLASFANVEDACRAASAIIAQGLVPAALELMDQDCLRIIEDGIGAGYPRDAGAVLLVELDGPVGEVEAGVERATEACRSAGASHVRAAADEAERARLWRGRKGVAGAFGRLGLAWLLQDVVVPRSRLPEMARRLREAGRRHDVAVPTVSHIGDGNLHPLFCYDERDPGAFQRALAAADETVEAALALGGSVTGEHGIGVDKRAKMARQFDVADLAFMARVRAAVDPTGRMNPGKLIPDHPACAEAARQTRDRVGSALDGGAWV